jgi:hypothetical protein
MRQNCRRNHNTRFAFNYFFFQNRAFYEIIWKNIVGRGRTQITVRRMRTACWVHKATDSHSEYVIIVAFPQKECTNVPNCYVHAFIVCLVCTGWSKSLCAPDIYNTENYKYCSKCPPPVSRQLLTRHRDTRPTLVPSVIPNPNYDIIVSNWNCLISFCVFCAVIIGCTQTFWSPCISETETAVNEGER